MINTSKIKARIIELGLTQEEIANKMGMDYSTFNLKINKKRRMYIDEVTKLAKILGIKHSIDLKDYFGLDFLVTHISCEKETQWFIRGAKW